MYIYRPYKILKKDICHIQNTEYTYTENERQRKSNILYYHGKIHIFLDSYG